MPFYPRYSSLKLVQHKSIVALNKNNICCCYSCCCCYCYSTCCLTRRCLEQRWMTSCRCKRSGFQDDGCHGYRRRWPTTCSDSMDQWLREYFGKKHPLTTRCGWCPFSKANNASLKCSSSLLAAWSKMAGRGELASNFTPLKNFLQVPNFFVQKYKKFRAGNLPFGGLKDNIEILCYSSEISFLSGRLLSGWLCVRVFFVWWFFV